MKVEDTHFFLTLNNAKNVSYLLITNISRLLSLGRIRKVWTPLLINPSLEIIKGYGDHKMPTLLYIILVHTTK